MNAGRNHPCSCGSGIKFKKCCHNLSLFKYLSEAHAINLAERGVIKLGSAKVFQRVTSGTTIDVIIREREQKWDMGWKHFLAKKIL